MSVRCRRILRPDLQWKKKRIKGKEYRTRVRWKWKGRAGGRRKEKMKIREQKHATQLLPFPVSVLWSHHFGISHGNIHSLLSLFFPLALFPTLFSRSPMYRFSFFFSPPHLRFFFLCLCEESLWKTRTHKEKIFPVNVPSNQIRWKNHCSSSTMKFFSKKKDGVEKNGGK